MTINRRMMLGGLAASLGSAAWAEAPDVSLRPVARSGGPKTDVPPVRPKARSGINDLIADAGLEGLAGVVIADARTGVVIEQIGGDVPRPPASVTKAVTALYALEGLGGGHRFATRVIATGPVVDGVLQGDLVLAGGGDPTLVTDDLAGLATALAATGLKQVTGDFLCWGNALRGVDEIDDSQLDHLGYNPAVSGLNLNFNRVHFEWRRQSGKYSVAMDARSEQYRPVVTSARMQVVDRSVPVFTYRDGGSVDEWTVARGALGDAGSRWLPVRHPARYAGDVFQTFARAEGIILNTPQEVDDLPRGTVLASHNSADLTRIMRDMLKYSTNLTAEVAGLAATQARTGEARGMRTSAFGMTRWVGKRADIAPTFVDHSGLGDQSRISALDMVRLLTADAVQAQLQPIMKNIVLRDTERRPLPDPKGQVAAKTGTLNFVSTLAGYMTTRDGRTLAFAMFAADPDAREAGQRSGDEMPAGAAGFDRRAKGLQQLILQRYLAS